MYCVTIVGWWHQLNDVDIDVVDAGNYHESEERYRRNSRE